MGWRRSPCARCAALLSAAGCDGTSGVAAARVTGACVHTCHSSTNPTTQTPAALTHRRCCPQLPSAAHRPTPYRITGHE
jgi:hypothetical protein